MPDLQPIPDDEDFLSRQQCPEREGDGTGYQCELAADHLPERHACPVALENWLKLRRRVQGGDHA